MSSRKFTGVNGPESTGGSGSSVKGFIKDESLAAKVLEALRAANGGWVPARELSAISLQYCARIAHLRSLGHKIENKVVMRDGTRLGFYRLVPAEAPAKKASATKPQPESLDLFSPADLEGVRSNYVDPEEIFG